MNSEFFQDFMPGNVCFGCGSEHPEGLKIKSRWIGDESECIWSPQEKYHGWASLLNGGIMATLIDCHCMCTAMAHAYREENRTLGSKPDYRYATGTIEVKYLKPTPTTKDVKLIARVKEYKGRKVVLHCDFFSEDQKTAEANVVAIRVLDSSTNEESNLFR